jgi:hypothetical protein
MVSALAVFFVELSSRKEEGMSDQQAQGPEPVPHEAWYFLYAVVGVLAVLIVGWIVKMQ